MARQRTRLATAIPRKNHVVNEKLLREENTLCNVYKTSRSVLSGIKNTTRSQVFLDPLKHLLGVFLNAFKNIPQRACTSGLKTMVQIVRGEY